jgi:hypothetical protein
LIQAETIDPPQIAGLVIRIKTRLFIAGFSRLVGARIIFDVTKFNRIVNVRNCEGFRMTASSWTLRQAPGPSSESLQRRNPREIGQGCGAAMGI